MGRLAYYVDKRHLNVAIDNLTFALGEKYVKRIAKKVFENLGINLMEFFYLTRLKRGDLEGYVCHEGLENLEKAYEKGKGVILLSAHFGNWELLSAAIALWGYPLNVVVRKLDNPILDTFVEGVRTRFGTRVIDKRASMRRLVELLKAEEMVGVLLDQNTIRREGVFVDYFGRPACTNKGLASLALKSGATVIPVFIVREGRGSRHKIIFGEEIPLTRTGDRKKDVIANTAKFTKCIEGFVREYPDHWFWVHRRWKTRDTQKGGGEEQRKC